MKRVRYLSGNQTGKEQDLPDVEAQAALDTGFAELVVKPPAKGATPKQQSKAAPAKPRRKPRR